MKRGFLRGQQLAVETKSTDIIRQNPAKIKIPSTYPVPGPYDDPPGRPIGDPVLLTTLPPVDDARLNESTIECIVHDSIKAKILAFPGCPQPVNAPSIPRYEIKPIRGVGLGMFATQDIDIGEVIVRERPLIMAIGSIRVSPYACQQPRELHRMVAERLLGEYRDAFFALHNCKGYTLPHVTGIMETNAIGFGLGIPDYDAECQAVCKDISRVNHSCSPNSMWSWQLEALAVELRATWSIKKGEQIFVRYHDIYESREKRKKLLLERYKFECICRSCSSKDPISDMSRKYLKASSDAHRCGDETALRSWVGNSTLPDDKIIVQCRFMIRICEEEGFFDGETWPVWFQRLVKAYCALEDEDNARFWAKKAAKLSKVAIGHDAGWNAVAEDPTNTDWWGLRRESRSGIQLIQNLDNFGIKEYMQSQGAQGLSAILL